MKSYVDMTTEELREILREDFKKPSDEAMTFDEVQPILEVLMSREGRTKEQTEKAWEDFQKYYRPSVEDKGV